MCFGFWAWGFDLTPMNVTKKQNKNSLTQASKQTMRQATTNQLENQHYM